MPIAAGQLIHRPPNAGAKSAIQSGTVAMISATKPLGRYCSPQATPPLPKSRRHPPITSADLQWISVSRSRGAPGRCENASSRSPARMNRAPDISSAGMVSIAMWIVRYVEPQMTYTAAKATTI